MEQKTPLYEAHVARDAKIVPFAGYLLPVQYPTGVIAEHLAVRERAGLFDVSHMGEVTFSGPDALKNLNNLMTNDFTNMYDGQVRYSPMCNDAGGVIDDLLVYRVEAEKYLVVVNAANRQKDVDWMRAHIGGDMRMEDISDRIAQVALQGPKAHAILAKLCGPESIPQKYYSFVESGTVKIPGGEDGDGPVAVLTGGGASRQVKPAEITCIISKTGYTGEDGYELYCDAQDAVFLWDALLEAGVEDGLIPCGLGARDTLRLEAAMPLYGHEMDETVTPLETGLGFAVKLKKADFLGKTALETQNPPPRKRIGLKMTGRGIARERCEVFQDGKPIGFTTSGTHCPYLGGAYAMALVETEAAQLGDALEVDVRGRRIAAEVVELPFYKRAK